MPKSEASITQRSLLQYEQFGYIAFPHLLTTQEVDEARDALAAVMRSLLEEAKEGRAKYRPPTGATGNYDGALIERPNTKLAMLFEHSYDPLSAPPDEALERVRKIQFYEDAHEVFTTLVNSPRIKGVAEELLSDEAVLFQTMALVKPAYVGSEKPWHQDNAYFKYAPLDKVVGFWVALDDATVDNGCMHVLAGWHRRGGLKHFHQGDCQIMPDRLAQSETVPVELPAGGAMFFSGMLPHQTPPNRSPKPRRALQFHYRAASTRIVDQAEYDRLFAEADGTPASCAAAARS